MHKAEELARRWMPGRREGPANRFAWEHPADLVRVLTTEIVPAGVPSDELEKRIELAWLHDILEDGRKEDGSPVTMYDLMREQVIVEDVLAMTRREHPGQDGKPFSEPKEKYLARLKEASPRAKLVKCVDRICNLREGKAAFKDRRWIRYVGETYLFIYPLTEDLPVGAERNWLQAELVKAVQARQL